MLSALKTLSNKTIKYALWAAHPVVAPWLPRLSILSSIETLERVSDKKTSLARFGDGELRQALLGVNQSIQRPNEELDARLRDILKREQEHLLVCLPGLLERPNEATAAPRRLWKAHRIVLNPLLSRVVGEGREFGEALVTRPFLVFQDLDKAHETFVKWKELFRGRDLVVIEGDLTRLGIGSDLFDGAASIRRILCPATNAFNAYAQIIAAALEAPRKSLFILALGKTATVLAADLAAKGRQALDVGNLDVEYYWYKNRCKRQVAVPGKFTYEAEGGASVGPCLDQAYHASVSKRLYETQE